MLKCGLNGALSALSILGVVSMAPAVASTRVAMVTSESGLGDKSFNDMMHEGMEKAKKDLDIAYVVIQPRSVSEFQSALARAAGQGLQGADRGLGAQGCRWTEAQACVGGDRGSELLRPQAWPEGDGQASDGDAAVRRQRKIGQFGSRGGVRRGLL
jgi:hypothetical protein